LVEDGGALLEGLHEVYLTLLVGEELFVVTDADADQSLA
jgi:hypothetical protein